MKRACLATILFVVGLAGSLITSAQAPSDSQNAARGTTRAADRARLQVTIMEDAFQRAVENTHSRQLEDMMPSMFSFDANVRARGFRLEGYGVFFDVDLPPIPRSLEFTLRALDTGAVLVPDIKQLKVLVASIADPAVRRQIEPVVRSLESKATAGPVTFKPDKDGTISITQRPMIDGKPAPAADPFRGYVSELTEGLADVMLDFGATIQISGTDYLTVAAREMQPRLMPGNPTAATITLRIKAGDLAALKAGSITREEARRRIEIKELY